MNAKMFVFSVRKPQNVQVVQSKVSVERMMKQPNGWTCFYLLLKVFPL